MLKNLSKKSKILTILAVFLIILIGIVIIIALSPEKVDNGEGLEIKNEFEKLNSKVSEDGKEYPEVNIPSNNILKYTTIDEVLNILNNWEDAVIYFGNPTCIYCRSAIEVLVDTSKNTELDVIYYLNVDENNAKYNELVTSLGEELTYKENNTNKVYTPLVVFITDGKVVSYNKGTLFSHEDPYKELNESQKQGLSEIYKYGINDVVSSKKLKAQ